MKVSVSLSIMTKRHAGSMEIKVHYVKVCGSHSSPVERNPSMYLTSTQMSGFHGQSGHMAKRNIPVPEMN